MRVDPRPIGIFDSGVGGLTVLREVKRRLPRESTVYLGDTARVPYGPRSAATVTKYAINNARTLLALADIKALVVACNTASAHALPALTEALPIPVVGVIEPGARAALAASTHGTIVVLGTSGTVRSGAYPRAIGPSRRVEARACPLFVPLVEEGWTTGDVPRLIAEQYLRDLPTDTSVIVLGCTHYPLLAPVLRAAVPAPIDGAAATAVELEALLRARDIQAPADSARRHRLLVTDAPEQLARVAPAFLGEAVDPASVELVDVLMTA
jgi:glutamate racemase